MKKRVSSLMRPTGRLHIGHYFGALENWLKLQDTHECFFGIADWHALTTNYENPENIHENTRQLLIDWLSVGIDMSKSHLYVQSHNIAHAEMYLLLGMISPVTWLERTPSYKEIQAELSNRDLANYGFLGYPVLMTSDIILYSANYVPVGVDQVPHVELSRELVRRFHSLYNCNIFVEPESLLTKTSKLPGLDGRKMSKSYNNSIMLGEEAADIEKKVKQMVTDVNRVRKTDKGDPEVCPVYSYHKIFSTADEQEYVVKGCTTAGIGCIECKMILVKHLQNLIAPIRERRHKYDAEIKDVRDYLSISQGYANQIAAQKVAQVRDVLKI